MERLSKRLQLSEKAKLILDCIPFADWVDSRSISVETGINSREVGAIISNTLLYKYVRRRKTMNRGGSWIYQRMN